MNVEEKHNQKGKGDQIIPAGNQKSINFVLFVETLLMLYLQKNTRNVVQWTVDTNYYRKE